MSVLAVLGLLHGVLFFPGEILLFYAIVGAIALPLRKLDRRALAAVAATAFLLGLVAIGIHAGTNTPSSTDGREPAHAEAYEPAGLQLHNRYLVTENEQGMVVIDQHALHERVIYEQLRERVLAGQDVVGILSDSFFFTRLPVASPSDVRKVQIVDHDEHGSSVHKR